MFKSAIPYQINPSWNLTPDQLEEQLSRAAFTPCKSNEPSSIGWGVRDGSFVTTVKGYHLIQLVCEKKLLPSSVINAHAKKIAKDLEDQQGFAPGRKQMREIKERALEELLPKALSQQSITRAWFDFDNRLFFVEASSPSKADTVVEQIRRALDEFPLLPVNTELSPVAWMADRLISEERGELFSVDHDCELVSCEENKATVKYNRHTLDLPEIKTHLSQGKMPKNVAFTWNDRVSFVLNEKMVLKRITLLDVLKNEGEDAENADEQFEIDFYLSASSIAKVFGDLVEAMGGYQ